MTKCNYCESVKVRFDGTSGMWFCPDCSRFLEENEVSEFFEDEEDLGYEYDDQEELTGVSLIVLNLLMYVPVLNMFMIGVLGKSDVKSQYRKVFTYRFIVDLCLVFVVFLLIIRAVGDYKVELSNGVHKVVESAANHVSSMTIGEVNIPEFISMDLMQIIESQRESDTDINDERGCLPPTWDYLNGATITGRKLLDMLGDTGEEFIILIQTGEIRSRYSKTTYRNVGYMVKGASATGSTGNYFFDGDISAPIQLYTDDYGEKVYMKTDDLYSQRYIYYINPKYNYVLHVLFDEDHNMLGLAFEEVS